MNSNETTMYQNLQNAINTGLETIRLKNNYLNFKQRQYIKTNLISK